MGIHQQPIPALWSYFLVLESDVAALSRWVHFDERNFAVFSIEIARLLMTACAEVDVVTKAVCKSISPNPKSRIENMGHYQNILREQLPSICKSKVHMPAFGLDLMPWVNWAGEEPKALIWWDANNQIKHRRGKSFEMANLKNLLNAVAALVIILMVYYRTVESVTHVAPMPSHFLPLTFAMAEGQVGPLNSLRLFVPDGNPAGDRLHA